MAEKKVLQLWARQGGRSLRSGSLFNQPVASRLDNVVVGEEAPDGKLDPDTTTPVRAARNSFFIRDTVGWKYFHLYTDGRPARGILPQRFVKADRNLAGSKDLIQWDSDTDFFYLSPLRSEEWKRIPYASPEVPRSDNRRIALLSGGTLKTYTGIEVIYTAGDAPQPAGFLLADMDGNLLTGMDGNPIPAVLSEASVLDGIWSDAGSWVDGNYWNDGVLSTPTTLGAGVWSDTGVWSDASYWTDAV